MAAPFVEGGAGSMTASPPSTNLAATVEDGTDAGAQEEDLRRVVNPEHGDHDRDRAFVEIEDVLVRDVKRDELRAEGEEEGAYQRRDRGLAVPDLGLGEHAKQRK